MPPSPPIPRSPARTPRSRRSPTKKTPSKQTPRKDQLIAEEKNEQRFGASWTPTRMTTQLQNREAAARRTRAWDRELRPATTVNTGAHRQSKRIFKRFEQASCADKENMPDDRAMARQKLSAKRMGTEEASHTTQRGVKRIKLAGGEAAVSKWEAAAEAIRGMIRKPKSRIEPLRDQSQPVDAPDAAESDSSASNETDAVVALDVAGDAEPVENSVEEPALPFADDLTAVFLEGAQEASDVETRYRSGAEIAEAQDQSMSEAPHSETADPDGEGLPSENLLDDASVLKEPFAAAASDDATVTEALPSRLFELAESTPDVGSQVRTFTGPTSETMSTSSEEDIATCDQAEEQDVRSPESTSEDAEMEDSKSDANGTSDTVTLPPGLFAMQELEEAIERQQAHVAEEASDHSGQDTSSEEASAAPASPDGDMFDLTAAAPPPASNAAPPQAPVEVPAEAADDMFAVNIESISSHQAELGTPASSGREAAPLLQNAWDETITIHETTTTVQLNDDETVLRDFLHRSRANKAARIAKRSSLSNRRDSDVVRTALASPRKRLEEPDSNSPVASPLASDAARSEGPGTKFSSPTPPRKRSYEDDLGEVDELSEAPSGPSRRSGRGRAGRLAGPTITLRRVETMVSKRTAAQEEAYLLRNNTKRNKGNALPAAVMLQRLREALPDVVIERADPAADAKAVRWKKDEDLASYLSIEARDAPDEAGAASSSSSSSAAAPAMVEPATASNEPAPVVTRGRSKRLRALGAMNGTPTKTRARASADEDGEKTADVKPAIGPAKKAASLGKRPAASPEPGHEQENVAAAAAAAAAAAQPTPAPAAPKTSRLPMPRSSARLRSTHGQ